MSWCRKCGEPLEMDPDGGWCPYCETYWDITDVLEYAEEIEGE